MEQKYLVKDSVLLSVEERKVDVSRSRKARKGKNIVNQIIGMLIQQQLKNIVIK